MQCRSELESTCIAWRRFATNLKHYKQILTCSLESKEEKQNCGKALTCLVHIWTEIGGLHVIWGIQVCFHGTASVRWESCQHIIHLITAQEGSLALPETSHPPDRNQPFLKTLSGIHCIQDSSPLGIVPFRVVENWFRCLKNTIISLF